MWLTEEVGALGLVPPPAIVAAPLVVYFDWRARLLNQIRVECDERRQVASGGNVLHTSNEYRTGAAAAIAPTIVGVDAFAEEANKRRRRLAAERALDQVLADSFPASDPPSWNTGIVRPGPRAGDHLEPHAERFEAIADTAARAVASDVLDVSRPSSGDRTFLRGLMSLAGAAGVALLVPFVILLVGLPVVLAVRGVLEVMGWIVGVALQ